MNTEELELLSDSKYRNYVAAIDKALKNFEYSSEWADLISALGKLNKVLQNNAKYQVVPKKTDHRQTPGSMSASSITRWGSSEGTRNI